MHFCAYSAISEFLFHVKHCEIKQKIVIIIPVRIKKRKVKKEEINRCQPLIISFRYFHFLHFKNLPLHDIQVPSVFLRKTTHF